MSPQDVKRVLSSLEGGAAFALQTPWGNEVLGRAGRWALPMQAYRVALLLHAHVPLVKGTMNGIEYPWGALSDEILKCGGSCQHNLDPALLHCGSCNVDATQSQVHDAIRDLLYLFSLEAKQRAGKEVATGLEFSNGFAYYLKDADVWLAVGPDQLPLALDVKTYVSSGDTLDGRTGLDVFLSSALRWKFENAKFNDHVRIAKERNAANGHSFTPFLSDWYGGLHPSARDHLNWLAQTNSTCGHWQGSASRLYASYCRRLSVVTAVAYANMVASKITKVTHPTLLNNDQDEHPTRHFDFIPPASVSAHLASFIYPHGLPPGLPISP